MLLFAASILGQWLTSWRASVEDAGRHGGPAMSLSTNTFSPEFLSTVFENWKSEFLQMSTYVVLTAIPIQRGSAESKDPDDPPRDDDRGYNYGPPCRAAEIACRRSLFPLACSFISDAMPRPRWL